MRTLQILLLFVLSILWEPSVAFATVQTVQPTTATAQQASPATPQKQTRFEKKVQKFAKYRSAGRGFNGDASQWLWYALGFVLISVIVGLLSSALAYLFWVVAVVCLVVWVLKFFGML
jgi:Flp pilus assembly protein TadB